MRRLLAIALLLPLIGCVQERSPIWIPSDIAPMFGGGSAPAPAPAQPNVGGTAGVMLAQEQHGAVNQSDCAKMAQRFKRAGRRVRLVRVVPNTLGAGGVLRYMCIFEGEDAQEGWYGQ